MNDVDFGEPTECEYFFVGPMTWKVMQRNVWKDIAKWRTRRLNNYTKSQHHALTTTTSRKKKWDLLENLSKVCSHIALKCLYHAARNLFERFRVFLELISRFEFEFCRCENFFLKDSNFWCVHVNVPWLVCAQLAKICVRCIYIYVRDVGRGHAEHESASTCGANRVKLRCNACVQELDTSIRTQSSVHDRLDLFVGRDLTTSGEPVRLEDQAANLALYNAVSFASKHLFASCGCCAQASMDFICNISVAICTHSSMCSSLMTVKSSLSSRSVTIPLMQRRRIASLRVPCDLL